MGRYVILLIAPVIIGVLIATGVVVTNGLRRRRIDVRRTLLEARRLDRVLSPREKSSDLTHRRIAS